MRRYPPTSSRRSTMTVTENPTTPMFTTDHRVTRVASGELYRDIHKGIRSERFDVTETAGQIDPADHAARLALAERIRGVVDLLESHAHHEDVHVEPVVMEHLPELAAKVSADHAEFS